MQAVQITQPALNMIESLHAQDAARVRRLRDDVERIAADPAAAHRMSGYSDVFVARAGGVRVIYRKASDSITVLSVLAERGDAPHRL